MIVFPMAGLSRRFTEAGYSLPKYMLEAHGHSLFRHAVSGFSSYFDSVPFIFIARDVAGTADFIRAECEKLAIRNSTVVLLDRPTAGQAETVALGVARGSLNLADPLTIFNIDTFRPKFRFPEVAQSAGVDGYLEVFRGEGSNWSYVEPAGAGSDRVVRTTEKVPISDLCCTGLYHFTSAQLYMDAYQRFADGAASEMGLSELYVAPLYNLLIRDGRDIRYHIIGRDEVIFCGVPAEYDEFLRRDDIS